MSSVENILASILSSPSAHLVSCDTVTHHLDHTLSQLFRRQPCYELKEYTECVSLLTTFVIHWQPLKYLETRYHRTHLSSMYNIYSIAKLHEMHTTHRGMGKLEMSSTQMESFCSSFPPTSLIH